MALLVLTACLCLGLATDIMEKEDLKAKEEQKEKEWTELISSIKEEAA